MPRSKGKRPILPTGETALHIFEGNRVHLGTEWGGNIARPPFSRVYFILGGDPYIQWNGKEILLPPGTCCLLPAGLSFAYGCRTEMEQLYFHISLVRDGVRDMLSGMACPVVCDAARAEVDALLAAAHRGTFAAQLSARATLEQFVARLLQASGYEPDTRAYSACVSRAIRHIQAEPNMQLSMQTLADGAFVSPSTLARMFRKETGKSVRCYIEDVVFGRAQLMLRQSEGSIAQISDALGFCDQFYFSRRFRQRYDKSPRVFRQEAFV